MICVYCGEDKDVLESKGKKYKFSKEHILPRSLIGTPINNPFTIKNICGVCNNQAGLTIDAPAISGWFMHLKMSAFAGDYAKIEDNPVLPLIYMGKHKKITFEDKICDVWIGPTGDSIYHFHEPYPESKTYPAIVGKPPYLKDGEYDLGFAFLFVVSNNEVWHPTIFWSFIKKFKGAKLYLGNGDKPKGNAFSEIPENLVALHLQLSKGDIIEVNNHFTPNSENRFLAKVALGIGAKYLGENFIKSEAAAMLRKYMWTKDDKERQKIPLHGTNFFSPDKEKDTSGYFGYEGGHLITLMNLADCVSLTINLYNSISASIKIDKSEDDYKDKIGDGICIVIIPALNKVVGPIKQIHFLNHKLRMGRVNSELTIIEKELKSRRNNRPPINI